ncbi:MAG: hypothetical protein R3190_14540, partial [Thermoanaerobaculia bacterium]|nr:hypothetical protein [Thermoanaerobaculia bacterium]
MSVSVWRSGGRLAAIGVLAVAVLVLRAPAAAQETAPLPAMYVLDFLGTASWGDGMNADGVVIGEKSIDVGCGSGCLAPTEMGVWTGVDFAALPLAPQWDTVFLEGINSAGWIVGTSSGAEIRGAVWKPTSGGYELIVIEPPAGTDETHVFGIDDLNRVVGYSYRRVPQASFSFVWTELDGIVELTGLGFPNDDPQAISPGGTVAYLWGWYQLDVPGVVHENAPPPPGFLGPGAYFEINDAGDQVRLLGPSSGQNLHYAFRYYNNGDWQQIWTSPASDLSPFGVGSITRDLDIALTISANGLLAPGPAQGAESLTNRLSPAYGDAYVTEAAALSEAGEVLARVMMGRSQRLVRMVEGVPCTASCLVVARLQLMADFVDDPTDPGRCVGTAHTRAQARVQVVDESGRPVAGA